MKKAIIYARHLESRESEKSVEEQVKECEKYAKENEIEVVDCYSDYLYNKDRKSNAFECLVRRIKKEKVDFVIVYDTTVLGRKAQNIFRLMRAIYSSNKEYIDISNKDKEETKLFNFVQKELFRSVK